MVAWDRQVGNDGREVLPIWLSAPLGDFIIKQKLFGACIVARFLTSRYPPFFLENWVPYPRGWIAPVLAAPSKLDGRDG